MTSANALPASLRAALAEALGAPVSARRLSGGDINDAYAVTLDDGRELFVKTHAAADPRMFPCEARGLAWLAEAEAVRVPAVLAVRGDDAGACFLALELLTPGPRRRDFDVELGRGLAALHRTGAPGFGFDEPNFIATLPQDNRPCSTWSQFYAERRLLPQVRRAVDAGRAPKQWIARFDQLCAKLDQLTGPTEPPARLHGDLWGGNLHAAPDGAPVLIDPAVYAGHREIDLAMLALFGGVSDRMYDAYHEVWPLAPGWPERVALYQLYPLLVHVNLFGGGYAAQVERAARGYL
ncbi:fructosamine kinase family protein [Haliangium sp.]|uniref:fructosamine kinase family protein n=1 Tax=Haliangium sp. TaxID=2663208 RepID=UPI003D09BAC6